MKANHSHPLLAKYQSNRIIVALIAAALSIGGYFFVRYGLAASSTLYLSPASQTVAQNDNLSILVKVNTGGDAVSGVEADLVYPADKLQFVGIDGANSAFPTTTVSRGGNGLVHMARSSGTINPSLSGSYDSGPSGDLLVAVVNFKVLAASGSIVVNFGSESAVYSASDSSNLLVNTLAGTYNLAEPVNPSPQPTSGVKAPTVALSSPIGGQTVSGPSVSISADANESNGIEKVGFLIDGSLVGTATNTAAITDCYGCPARGHYEITWNSTAVASGTHSLVAKAYDPIGNIMATSTIIDIIVSNTRPINQPLPPPPPPLAAPPPPVAAPPPAPKSIQGDLNSDGKVDGADLSTVLRLYGTTDLVADVNGDGQVNGQDLSIILRLYGT